MAAASAIAIKHAEAMERYADAQESTDERLTKLEAKLDRITELLEALVKADEQPTGDTPTPAKTPAKK